MNEHLQEILYTQIPLTQSIGIKVGEYNNHCLTLTAPLANNINHKHTAFGGSLYSVCVLTGWSLLYLLLDEHNLTGHIVIQESNIRYLKPVNEMIRAQCSFDSEDQKQTFIRTYSRKGKARINLQATVVCNGQTSVVFEGKYVVYK